MCFNANIDDILEQIKKCSDPAEKRRLLEEMNPCKVCPLAKQAPQCLLSVSHQKYNVELMNIIEYMRQCLKVPENQKKYLIRD